MCEKEIIEERIKQQKQYYSSIDKGMYICGDIVEFKPVYLFDGLLCIEMPADFIEMPQKFQQVKYPSQYRPQIIMTSMDLSVNMGLTMFMQKQNEEPKKIAESIKSIIKKSYPDYRFFGSEYIREEKKVYSWFDFRSYAFDDAVYNMHIIMQLGKALLQGSFNCPYSQAEDWKKAMIQMIKSIKRAEEKEIEGK